MAITLPIFILSTHINQKIGKKTLIIISLFFYSYWLPIYLPILLFSIVFNFLTVKHLNTLIEFFNKKIILFVAISANLLLLVYFKYFNFFIENISYLTGWDGPLFKITLPLGISFFTFQQIAFLISYFRNEIRDVSFIDYLLFVSFFPQLIAGPIVSQNQFFPQLKKNKYLTIDFYNFNLGFFLFSLGLFKKTVLIDPYTPYLDILFEQAANGYYLSTLDAWTATIGYTFQIYFDFSGYSDMALGLALIFGIRLPFNFFSPYKAENIQEFWRRWHITLSNFLRDYLYIPFGGSRHGQTRTLFALLVTMFLGGLWHGAGWTFVVWGLYHGALLGIHSLWVQYTDTNKLLKLFKTRQSYRMLSILITFTFVSLGWVFFRSLDLSTAFRILFSLFGNYTTLSLTDVNNGIVLAFPLYFVIIWFFPNSIEILSKYNITSSKIKFMSSKSSKFVKLVKFRMTPIWAFISLILFFSSWVSLSNISPFIYFQF